MAQQELDYRSMDRRILDRLVRRGEVSEKDVEKALKQLPDAAEEAAPVEVKMDLGDDGE